MKKFILQIIFLNSLLFSVEAEGLNFAFTTGTLQVGGRIQEKEADLYGEMNIFDFNFQSPETGLGFNISPAYFTGKNNDKLNLTLLNASFFYEILKYQKNIEVFPYARILCLNPFDIKYYEAEIGFNFSLYACKEKFKYFRTRIFTISTGVGIKENKLNAYVKSGMDLGLLFYLGAQQEYEKYKSISGISG